MCIYCTTNNYRKIYENHVGEIPRESNGRTYEIHHIDGNHDNNHYSNLTAVSLQEHYDIHFSNGDYNACKLMKLQRMDRTPEEISELTRLANQKKIDDGSHPLLKREDGSSVGGDTTIKKIEEGSHPWQTRSDGTSVASDRVTNGTFHLLGGKIQSETNLKHWEQGTHALQREDIKAIMAENREKRLRNGTHIFSPGNNPCHKQLADGAHPSKIKISCIYCQKETDIANFSQRHGELCPSKNSENKMIGKVSCRGCKKATDRANFAQHHKNKCKILKNE